MLTFTAYATPMENWFFVDDSDSAHASGVVVLVFTPSFLTIITICEGSCYSKFTDM